MGILHKNPLTKQKSIYIIKEKSYKIQINNTKNKYKKYNNKITK